MHCIQERVCVSALLGPSDCCYSLSSMQMIPSHFYTHTPALSLAPTSFYLYFEEVKLTFISHVTTGDCHFRLFILIFASFACHLNDNRGYRKMVKSATDCNSNGRKKNWLVPPVVVDVVFVLFLFPHTHIHPPAMLTQFAFGDRFPYFVSTLFLCLCHCSCIYNIGSFPCQTNQPFVELLSLVFIYSEVIAWPYCVLHNWCDYNWASCNVRIVIWLIHFEVDNSIDQNQISIWMAWLLWKSNI